MQFHASLSDAETATEAVAQVIEDSLSGTDGEIDVAFVFFTAHHRESAAELVEEIWLKLDPQAVVGCMAEGVIAGDREIERAPGIAILAGSMPDVRIHPFHIGADDWRGLLSEDASDEFLERLGCGSETQAILGMADPFTTPLTQLLSTMDSAAPGVPLIGGMASASRSPGGNWLIHNDGLYDDGMVGLSISGPANVQALVSQGCRPVGRPMVVTKSHDNVIQQLGGRPALEVLRELVNSMSPADESLLRKGLFVGQAVSEYRDTFGRGDFLVRNVIGIDEGNEAIEMADFVRTGRTVQFHVRDAATASEDLSLVLDAQRAASTAASAALLFNCNGRGTRLFDVSSHDARMVRQAMPRTPVAGFFAAGELGPIGGRNFVHGHTASMALFRRA